MVDEDIQARHAYTVRLRADGHAVDGTDSFESARAALVDVDYDCVVVGHLASADAQQMITEARRQRRARPVLVVANEEDADHRVATLEAGADDLIARPVSLEELALRVRKLIVRGSSQRPSDGLQQLGRVSLHRGRREVMVDGDQVSLTPIQYALFEHLLDNRKRTVSADELLQHCWDRNHPSRANPLPSQISRLRKALRGAVAIDAVRGLGYRMRIPDPPESLAEESGFGPAL